MARDCDVLIVGGGLNGPVLALALAQGGLSSIVLDARPAEVQADPAFDGRAYALALGSRRMLAALGLWRGLGARAQAISEIKISDGRAGEGAGRFWLHFDGDEIDEGPMGHILEDRYLRAALAAAVAASPLVEARGGAAVVGQAVAPGRAAVTLADGGAAARRAPRRLRRARQPGGAAGGHPAARARLRADARSSARWSTRCRTGGIAHQFFMPEGPLAILPLPGNRSSIVWTETTARAAAISGAGRGGLSRRAPPALRRLPRRDRARGRALFLSARAVAGGAADRRAAGAGRRRRPRHPPAGRAGAEPRAARRGDAGRGGGGGAPARRRTSARRTCSRRYERWRRFDIAALAAVTDGINRLFSNDNPLLRLGRDLGLGAGRAACRRSAAR